MVRCLSGSNDQHQSLKLPVLYDRFPLWSGCSLRTGSKDRFCVPRQARVDPLRSFDFWKEIAAL